MKARFFLNKIHFYLALISALPIAVLCLSGSVLVYKEAIDVYFTQPYMVVEKMDTKLSVSELKARLEKELPGKEFSGVVFPEKEGRSYFFWMKDAPYWTVAYIDPYTGNFKGVRAWEDWTWANIIWWMTDIHTMFKWGKLGAYLVAACSGVLLFSLLSGFYLWLPRKSQFDRSKFTLRIGKRWKQTAFNLHGVLGFYVSGLLIVITLTGVAITFYGPFQKLVHWVSFTPEPLPHPSLKGDPASGFLETEVLVVNAQKALKEKFGTSPSPQSLAFPTLENVIVEIGMQGKNEYGDADHSHVFVNAQSGEVVEVESAGNRSGAEKFISWIGPVHYGTWGAVYGSRGDIFTRLIWLVAALLPLFLMGSGFSIVKKSRWKGLFKK